jgi:hypothetical protein
LQGEDDLSFDEDPTDDLLDTDYEPEPDVFESADAEMANDDEMNILDPTGERHKFRSFHESAWGAKVAQL